MPRSLCPFGVIGFIFLFNTFIRANPVEDNGRIRNSLANDTVMPPPVYKIDTMVKISYGACYGNCPVSDMTIFNDGTAVWNGYKNTLRIGSQVGKLSRSQIMNLEGLINEDAIWSGADVFPVSKAFIPDFPNRRIFIKNNDRVKIILINHSPSHELKRLEVRLSELSDSLEWRNISN